MFMTSRSISTTAMTPQELNNLKQLLGQIRAAVGIQNKEDNDKNWGLVMRLKQLQEQEQKLQADLKFYQNYVDKYRHRTSPRGNGYKKSSSFGGKRRPY